MPEIVVINLLSLEDDRLTVVFFGQISASLDLRSICCFFLYCNAFVIRALNDYECMYIRLISN